MKGVVETVAGVVERLSLSSAEKKRLQQELEKMQQNTDAFLDACAKELAARLLRKVIKRTPVGQYPKGSGKMGGTLRRGWGVDTASKAKAYVASFPIKKVGSNFEIEIINPVEYASYVEFGHRTRDGAGWVEGRYMLTTSEETLRTAAPRILEKMLLERFKEAFNV